MSLDRADRRGNLPSVADFRSRTSHAFLEYAARIQTSFSDVIRRLDSSGFLGMHVFRCVFLGTPLARFCAVALYSLALARRGVRRGDGPAPRELYRRADRRHCNSGVVRKPETASRALSNVRFGLLGGHSGA